MGRLSGSVGACTQGVNNTSTKTAVGRPLVRLRNLSRHFGKIVAIHEHDLDIEKGEFLALLGPSGCGKTTLLRMIGGFLPPTSGSIEIDGEDVTRLGPDKRRTNLVFQGYGLFPHMTVRQNVAYGLVLAKTPRPEIDARVEQMLSLVHLDGFAERLPGALSGGQAQRVALARALVMKPAVLLLDESLAALDLKLRKAMQGELREIHRSVGGTFVFVTHDQDEAMALASRIAVMKDGYIVQQGTPKEIYEHPVNEFVADFIGETNKIKAARVNNELSLFGVKSNSISVGPDGEVLAVVRPDAVKITTSDGEYDYVFPARILDRIYFGSYIKYTIAMENGHTMAVTQGLSENYATPEIDEAIHIGWSQDHCTLVSPD
jgi:spermidine/putrescine transport system ATP-binding protein